MSRTAPKALTRAFAQAVSRPSTSVPVVAATRTTRRHESSSTPSKDSESSNPSSKDLQGDLVPKPIKDLVPSNMAKWLVNPIAYKLENQRNRRSQSGQPMLGPGQDVSELVNGPEPLLRPPTGHLAQELMDNATSKEAKIAVLTRATGLSADEIQNLHRQNIVMKKVSVMTRKGKNPSFFCMVVAGSPERGLVGIGRGRGQSVWGVMEAAFNQAVLNMDYVERYEKRTVWGTGKDLEGKFGATRVTMRGRPAGVFFLFCIACRGDKHRSLFCKNNLFR